MKDGTTPLAYKPKQTGFARWRGDAAARRAVINNRARLESVLAREAVKQRAEIVERSLAHNLDRGGMRRTWLRGHDATYTELEHDGADVRTNDESRACNRRQLTLSVQV